MSSHRSSTPGTGPLWGTRPRHWCLPPSSDTVPPRGRLAHHCLQSWPMGRPRKEGGWEVIKAGPGVTGRDR